MVELNKYKSKMERDEKEIVNAILRPPSRPSVDSFVCLFRLSICVLGVPVLLERL